MERLIIILFPTLLFAALQGSLRYLILDGARLGDSKEKTFIKYGKPMQINKFNDGVIAYSFWRNKDKKSYISFEIFPTDTNLIWSIQITGKPGVNAKGFMGINLGTPVDSLITVFGKPSSKTPLGDIPGYLIKYDKCNFTFEVNNNKINSIKILLWDTDLPYVDKYKDKIHVEVE